MRLRKLLAETKGATALEYALIALLISTACVGGMSVLGAKKEIAWSGVYEKIKAAVGY